MYRVIFVLLHMEATLMKRIFKRIVQVHLLRFAVVSLLVCVQLFNTPKKHILTQSASLVQPYANLCCSWKIALVIMEK